MGEPWRVGHRAREDAFIGSEMMFADPAPDGDVEIEVLRREDPTPQDERKAEHDGARCERRQARGSPSAGLLAVCCGRGQRPKPPGACREGRPLRGASLVRDVVRHRDRSDEGHREERPAESEQNRESEQFRFHDLPQMMDPARS